MKKAVPLRKKESIVKSTSSAIVQAGKVVENALESIATALSKPLPTPVLAQVTNAVKDWKGILEALEKASRAQSLELLQTKGKKVTDAGTLGLDDGGWHFEARPQHGEGTIDPKKLEGLLRAKGLDPVHYMDPIITFKFNPDKVDTILTKISRGELDTCKMEMSYAVQRPKRINDNG